MGRCQLYALFSSFLAIAALPDSVHGDSGESGECFVTSVLAFVEDLKVTAKYRN